MVMRAREKQGAGLKNVGLLVLVLSWMVIPGRSDAGTTARVLPSGEGIELVYSVDGGQQVDVIPIYKAGNVRYFSAGVGIEERKAEYPPFPLKLVFTAGGKPYLSGVTVKITDEKGATRVTIPDDQVTGPWLFVDLPVGTYHLTATKDDVTQGLQHVSVRKGSVKVVHLRWAEGK